MIESRVGLNDGGGMRRLRRQASLLCAVLLLAMGVPAALAVDQIRTEWALAFGEARAVTATVVGEAPSLAMSRSCAKQVDVQVEWADPAPARGHFTICEDAAGRYRAGERVRVAVLPGSSEVVVDPQRGQALVTVAVEVTFVLFTLWLLLAFVRPQLTVTSERARSHAGQHRIIGSSGADRQVQLVGGGAQRPTTVRLVPRRDGLVPRDTDAVFVVPVGRSLLLRRPRGPYALHRITDGQVFWANGPRLG